VGQDDYAGSTSTSGLLSVPTDTTRVYQTGTLTVAGDRDWFKVNMQSGFSFHFDAEGQDTGKGTLSDPYLYLYNSAGTLLLSADGGGTGKNAHLDYNATVTGTYYVGVGASGDNQTGTYRLTGWDPPTDQDSSGLSSAMSATLSQLSSTSGSAALTQGLSSSSSGSAADAASGSPLTSSSGSALAGALSTSASGGSTTTATATSTDSSSPAASGTTSASSSGSSSASSASSLASPVTSAAAAGAASSATAASANVLAAAAPTTTPSLTSGSSSTLASGLLAAAH
jgi:hypothetical protein